MSKDFIAAFGKDVNLSQANELIKQDFIARELIQEDWRDFVAAFFFPNLSVTEIWLASLLKSVSRLRMLSKGIIRPCIYDYRGFSVCTFRKSMCGW